METPSVWPSVTQAMVTISGSALARYMLDHVQDGWYQVEGDEFPVAGEAYVLSVTDTGWGDLMASSSVPLVKSSLLSYAVSPRDRQLGLRRSCEAAVRITDSPSAEYYLIRIQQATSQDGASPYTWTSFESSAAALRTSPEAVLDWAQLQLADDQFHWGAWFADDLFEGGTYDVDMDCRSYMEDDQPLIFRVLVTALSPELFEYEQTVAKQESYLGASLFFVQRPPSVKSNVEGGLGIFAGYHTVIHEFRYAE